MFKDAPISSDCDCLREDGIQNVFNSFQFTVHTIHYHDSRIFQLYFMKNGDLSSENLQHLFTVVYSQTFGCTAGSVFDISTIWLVLLRGTV